MFRFTVHAIALALTLALPLATATVAAAKPIVEVVFVLDTTGSMARLIEGAKRKIWSIATSIVECSPDAEIRMGLVAYRDIGDEYVTRKFQLTTDIQGLYADLLRFRAQGGGDWPESVNEALHTAVSKLSWTDGPGVTRIIFLVGDAPPHMDYAHDVKYPEVMRMARRMGITVNAVQAGNARDTERVWREIAQLGRGEYIPIPQDGGKMVSIESPYDRDIIEMQGKINGTVLPYGPRDQQRTVHDKLGQLRAAPAPAASDLATYMYKRSYKSATAEAITGRGDLVADVAAGRQKLGEVKDEDLPDSLKSLSATERKAHLDRQMAERKALNDKLSDLVRKRDAYVAEQRKKQPATTGDSFDRAVEATLKAQIKR